MQVLPQFCYLVDCGNVVEPNALCQLTQCFIDNPCVGPCLLRSLTIRSDLSAHLCSWVYWPGCAVERQLHEYLGSRAGL